MSKEDRLENFNSNCNSSAYIDSDCSQSRQVHFDSCEIFKSDDLEYINLNRCSSRILRVNVCLKNVCFGREVTLGCIVYDRFGKILAFKSKTFTVNRNNLNFGKESSKEVVDTRCCSPNKNSCGNTNQNFTFILPNHDICNPLDVNVKIIANYTSINGSF